MAEVDENIDGPLLTFQTANAASSDMNDEKEEEAADIDIEEKEEELDTGSAEIEGADGLFSPADNPVSQKTRTRKHSGNKEEPKKRTRSSVRDPVPRKHYSNEQEHPRAKAETEKKALKPDPKPNPKQKSTPKPTKQGSHTLWFSFTHQ